MRWIWQNKNWPNFNYSIGYETLEAEFLVQSGYLKGIYQHLNEADQSLLTIDLVGDEALHTSQIEGEYLNRDSLRSSIKRLLGFPTDKRKIPLAERGITEMLMDLYKNYNQALTHKMLCDWHLMLTVGRRDLERVGAYRTHQAAMQVVSGYAGLYKVYYEAPPSDNIHKEMSAFIRWFNQTAPKGKHPLPCLMRASIAHLYFVLIHPFEDGNGRIARALAEKALAQSIDSPSLISLSRIINKHKKKYYHALEQANKSLDITAWLKYFMETLLDAQDYTIKAVCFLIEKTKLFDRAKDQLNERQLKVINRIFWEGLEGFEGGLSAENYISITNSSRATATRDLHDLVEKNILSRQGERKSTRYYLVMQKF